MRLPPPVNQETRIAALYHLHGVPDSIDNDIYKVLYHLYARAK